MHGEQDRVMPVGLAAAAQQQLLAIGAQVRLDRFDGLGHGIDARVVEVIARCGPAVNDRLCSGRTGASDPMPTLNKQRS
jgi:predicted esterase